MTARICPECFMPSNPKDWEVVESDYIVECPTCGETMSIDRTWVE